MCVVCLEGQGVFVVCKDCCLDCILPIRLCYLCHVHLVQWKSQLCRCIVLGCIWGYLSDTMCGVGGFLGLCALFLWIQLRSLWVCFVWGWISRLCYMVLGCGVSFALVVGFQGRVLWLWMHIMDVYWFSCWCRYLGHSVIRLYSMCLAWW